MIVDPKTGRVAYHAIVFLEDGSGSDWVQYDFDGKELFRRLYRRYLFPLSLSHNV
jgi:hypothetical protein